MTDKVQDVLANQIYNGEYQISLANQQDDNDEYDELMALLDAQRQDKKYDWQSDIHIPEFMSHILTQISIEVDQYFSTRDFVEAYLEDEGEEAKAAAEAAKECVNRTLNRRELYHYCKFVRSKLINNLKGKAYLKCWWEQKTHTDIVGIERKRVPLEVDINGNPITRPDQVPATRIEERPVYGEVIDKDHFNYEVWDQRNVFTDNSFTYSLQDKPWVIFRSVMTKSEIEEIAEQNEYFNIDKLSQLKPANETEAERETTNKYDNFEKPTSKVELPFELFERYGKYWTVLEKDDSGKVTEKIGIDEQGEVLENAELKHVIITIVSNGSKHLLIGFRLTPFIDANGNPYIPAIRPLCYIHPAYDGGMGDGKYTKELQVAIDDTFNLSQDRVMLATMPTMKVKRTSMDDNSTIYFEPGHPIEVNEPTDIVEFQISDNITGALQQISMLQNKMQQVDAVQPPSMGNLPAHASTTATAVATASQGTSIRSQYKSLTFEYTGLTELYWMILQMTYSFAKPETAIKLMGEKVYNFDPTREYYYKPLSQSIETDQSKMVKRRDWIQILGFVSQIQHPDAVKMVNYVFAEIAKLMGDEYVNFTNKMLSTNVPIQGKSAPPEQYNIPSGASNQSMLPMSSGEMMTRTNANMPTT